MACRVQLQREAQGVGLGEIAAQSSSDLVEPLPVAREHPNRRRDDGVTVTDLRAEEADLGAAAHATPRVFAVSAESPREPAPRAAATAEAKPSGPPRRIAVFNHKGGTGKTTTSVNLAAGLAARGARVLLVDTDSQGNVGVSLGARSERSLYHVLVMGLRVNDAVQTIRPGLDLLPANETLAAAELYLAGRQNRDRVLAQRIAPIAGDYDYIIVDCSPSLSLMNQNALVLAEAVLVPVACDYLSLVGVRQVIKTVKNVNTLLRHPLHIWGVLPTFYDGRARICNEALETLRGHFGEKCLAPVRATTKLKEAPAQARSIFEHAPGTHGAEDYAGLVDALMYGTAKGPRVRATSA
ncbi:MAG: ParA family protein [Myxococcales bacterium]|nr:ParA family protein [Myxococcales bacterium]